MLARIARSLAAALALFTLVIVLGAASGCGGSSKGETLERPCPAGAPCQVGLTLLHTSDIHSRLFPFEQLITQVDATLGLGELNSVSRIGGVARLGYVLGRERARAGRVLHLDSGDCFQGAPIFNFFKGEPEVRAMSALGVDAAVVGNHEFDSGADNVARQMQRWARFELLSANYKFETQDFPNSGFLGTVTQPFVILNTGGLKVAAIGMANLSSLTSIFEQPNRLGITPLNTVEVAQFYVDLLRPYVDLVVMVTHLGLEIDQRMVRGTTGIDIVLGGHNHVVINPPQEIRDCSADPLNPGFVWAVDPNLTIDPNAPPPNDELHPDPVKHPWQFKRTCKPRNVVIAHSGAFSKYVGRLDLVLSNDPAQVSPSADPADYDPVNGFEVLTHRYQAFPIDERVPEDPVIVDMLTPYQRSLDITADLDILVGYSPLGSRRFATTGGDSPLGNLVANSIWLRLGIQTDFSMTNSTGIRADLNPGPISIEQMYNIFPFDNSIAKMQLSGLEVEELFDFTARRSAGRGCSSQIQIAGARVRLNCAGCDRVTPPCNEDIECSSRGLTACDANTKRCFSACQTDDDCRQRGGGNCDNTTKRCVTTSCAEQVYIGQMQDRDGNPRRCNSDDDCGDVNVPGSKGPPGSCAKGEAGGGLCLSLIKETNLYELATSNYLAGGGSGFRVLQRNTTQFDTKVQQRDALIDYMRQGKPCGYSKANGTPEGLKVCTADADCGDAAFVCACPGHVQETGAPLAPVCKTDGACEAGNGRCVRADCRDQVAQFHLTVCREAPNRDLCKTQVNACTLAGEECKILSCVDNALGARSDGRVEMLGR